jgi:hypothetical protein
MNFILRTSYVDILGEWESPIILLLFLNVTGEPPEIPKEFPTDVVVPLFREIYWFKAEEIILWRPKLVLLGTRFLLFCVAFVFSLMLLDDAATLNFSGRVGEKPCTIGDKPLFESPSIYIFSVFSASYPNYSVLYDFCINFCFFISLSLYF